MNEIEHGAANPFLPDILLGAPGPTARAPLWACSAYERYPVFAAPEIEPMDQGAPQRREIRTFYGWPTEETPEQHKVLAIHIQHLARLSSRLIFKGYLRCSGHTPEGTVDVDVNVGCMVQGDRYKPPTWMPWFAHGVPQMITVMRSFSKKRSLFPDGYIHAGRYHQFVLGRVKIESRQECWTVDPLSRDQKVFAFERINERRVRRQLASLVGYLDARFMQTMLEGERLPANWGIPEIHISPDDRVMFLDAKNQLSEIPQF